MDRPDHILIVDDDAEIRQLLSRYLEKNGLQATTVGDGRAMWRALDGANFDLIVLDLMLPGDDELIDFMLAHPILINRPIVVTPLGTRLCSPPEAVLDILPRPQLGAFTKGDGEAVIDAQGRRV